MPEDDFSFDKYVPEEKTRRVFAKVFDKQTIDSVHALAMKGHIDLLEFVISTGKEAHVFRARDSSGNFRAVKIYKIETTNFNNMYSYIDGDVRFEGVKKNRRDLVYAWARKEFKNLELFNSAGIRVPLPIAMLKNVLVMEFIGEKGEASPPLKDCPLKDAKKLHNIMVDFLARMFFKARLIHSDLSEYNILNKTGELVVIDCAQAVLSSHPNAKSFFERDVENISHYLAKNGIKTDKNALIEEIRSKKDDFVK